MRQKLSDVEIQRALGSLPGWTRRGAALTKTFQRPTFAEAIAFLGRVAEEADRRNHHPDIDIRYTKLTFTLSTHDAGGVTQLDLDLGAAIEQLSR